MTAPSPFRAPRLPDRFQQRRGIRLPDGARSVARPSLYGNPWRVEPGDPYRDRCWAVSGFHRDLWAGRLRVSVATVRAELRGLDLACYCPVDDLPCHAGSLLVAANVDPPDEPARWPTDVADHLDLDVEIPRIWAPAFQFGPFAWRVIDSVARSGEPDPSRRCRFRVQGRSCQAPSVVELNRSWRPGKAPTWWAYCPQHLYGRRVWNGVVWQPIRPEST